MNGQLLTVAQLQQQYGLGRDLTLSICNQLPRLYTGRGRLHVFENDWTRVLRCASVEGVDLVSISKQPGKITEWLRTKEVADDATDS